MKDRVPTQVLANGAVRWEKFNSDGTSAGYIYLKRADDPTEAGTPLNKSTLLTDATAAAIHLYAANPTVSEALAHIGKNAELATLFTQTGAVDTTISLPKTLDNFDGIFFNSEYTGSFSQHAGIALLSGSTVVAVFIVSNANFPETGFLFIGKNYVVELRNGPPRLEQLDTSAIDGIHIYGGNGSNYIYGVKRW